MSVEFLDHEPNANPIDRPAEKVGHWLYGGFAFALALFLLISIPWQTTYFEKVVWSKQPATWPSIAILGMLFTSAGHLVNLRKQKEQSDALPFREDFLLLVHAGELAIWFIGYIFTVGYLGYLLSNILFAMSLSWRIGYRSFRQYFLLAVVATVIVITFKSFLKVKIPGGKLYALFPEAIARFFNTYL